MYLYGNRDNNREKFIELETKEHFSLPTKADVEYNIEQPSLLLNLENTRQQQWDFWKGNIRIRPELKEHVLVLQFVTRFGCRTCNFSSAC